MMTEEEIIKSIKNLDTDQLKPRSSLLLRITKQIIIKRKLNKH